MIVSMQTQIMDDEASAKTEEESEDLENTKLIQMLMLKIL